MTITIIPLVNLNRYLHLLYLLHLLHCYKKLNFLALCTVFSSIEFHSQLKAINLTNMSKTTSNAALDSASNCNEYKECNGGRACSSHDHCGSSSLPVPSAAPAPPSTVVVQHATAPVVHGQNVVILPAPRAPQPVTPRQHLVFLGINMKQRAFEYGFELVNVMMEIKPAEESLFYLDMMERKNLILLAKACQLSIEAGTYSLELLQRIPVQAHTLFTVQVSTMEVANGVAVVEPRYVAVSRIQYWWDRSVKFATTELPNDGKAGVIRNLMMQCVRVITVDGVRCIEVWFPTPM